MKIVNKNVFDVLSRREIVFLHVPKTGGSSFWNSLANVLVSSKTNIYSVVDVHHECLVNGRNPYESIELLRDVFHRHLTLRIPRIIVHFHIPLGNIQSVLPNVGFVIIYRNPRDRLASAFRHWRHDNLFQDPLSFFCCFSSCGLNHYLSYNFQHYADPFNPPPQYLIDNVSNNVAFFSFDDFLNNTPFFQEIISYLGLDSLQPILFEGTVTNKIYNLELESLLSTNCEFSERFECFVHQEALWLDSLGLPHDKPTIK